MKPARFLFLAAAAVFTCGSIARADDTKILRHLVYEFSITYTSNNQQQNYSGTTTQTSSTGDRGTITADVIGEQPDSGLVVRISEQARQTRSAEPALCVAYGNGQLICDQSKKINEEEYSLLRLLGRNFINHDVIDVHNNWTYGTSGPDSDETNNYHIDSNNDGILSITLSRTLRVKGAQTSTAQTDGRVTYDEKMSVPKSLSEDTVTRDDGAQHYNRLEQQINLNLTTDSMASAGH
jgi:co-chaperonin GroES (HSP10)